MVKLLLFMHRKKRKKSTQADYVTRKFIENLLVEIRNYGFKIQQ